MRKEEGKKEERGERGFFSIPSSKRRRLKINRV